LNGESYHRQTSSSSSFFLRFPVGSLVGEDVGVTFSFFIGVMESCFFVIVGLISDFFSFLTTFVVVELDFL
jgi:hypothetical protein